MIFFLFTAKSVFLFNDSTDYLIKYGGLVEVCSHSPWLQCIPQCVIGDFFHQPELRVRASYLMSISSFSVYQSLSFVADKHNGCVCKTVSVPLSAQAIWFDDGRNPLPEYPTNNVLQRRVRFFSFFRFLCFSLICFSSTSLIALLLITNHLTLTTIPPLFLRYSLSFASRSRVSFYLPLRRYNHLIVYRSGRRLVHFTEILFILPSTFGFHLILHYSVFQR